MLIDALSILSFSKNLEMDTEVTAEEDMKPNSGVAWARKFGALLGAFYLFWGPKTYLELGEVAGTAHLARAVFIVFLGIMLMLPYSKFKAAQLWKGTFTLLCACSVAFVFTMIISVMFDYMAAAEREERLGVPGFEGTLIFLTLMQAPAVLFQRRPDMLS